MATTGKIAEVLFENALETYQHQDMLLKKVDFFQPGVGDMQNANNFVWRPVQQHAPLIVGFDISGQEQDIIEETYPAVLGDPTNDFVQQRADDLRDMRFWERRGKQSGLQQATQLNKAIAEAISLQGSLFYRIDTSVDDSGYSFIAQAQAIMNERQGMHNLRCYFLNDRDTLTFSKDLAARQTLQGRPESDAWSKGQIGTNVAEFNIYTASFLPNLIGGADPAETVTGDQSFKPEGGNVSATGVVTNVDYRIATIVVSDSSGYNIGDKVSIANGGTTVKSIGLADKTDTNQAMTFTIVGLPTGTTMQLFPKPIANDDPGLTILEKAYSNIDTQILNAATVNRLNIDATAKTNIFFDREAVEVLGGTIPADLFSQYVGFKVIHHTMDNGQEMYMIYDGNIASLTFRYRLFTWYGITIRDPSRCGVAVTF